MFRCICEWKCYKRKANGHTKRSIAKWTHSKWCWCVHRVLATWRSYSHAVQRQCFRRCPKKTTMWLLERFHSNCFIPRHCTKLDHSQSFSVSLFYWCFFFFSFLFGYFLLPYYLNVMAFNSTWYKNKSIPIRIPNIPHGSVNHIGCVKSTLGIHIVIYEKRQRTYIPIFRSTVRWFCIE